MTHPEPEILLSSVGGSLDEETERHVATCPQCRADLATMTRARAAGATLRRGPEPRHAGGATCRRSGRASRRELGGGEAGRARSGRAAARRPRCRRPPRPARHLAGRGRLGGRGRRPGRLGGRPGRTRRRRLRPPRQPRTSTLEPLGRSRHERDPLDDRTTVERVAVGGAARRRPGRRLPRGLAARREDRRHGVPRRPRRRARAPTPCPPGLDLAAYDQVDVSREPYDGDPAHSKVSLARGQVP